MKCVGELVTITRNYIGQLSTTISGIVVKYEPFESTLKTDDSKQKSMTIARVTVLKLGGRVASIFIYDNDSIEILKSHEE